MLSPRESRRLAMYDRAPRDLTQPQGTTAPHVGPGTYDANVVNNKRVKSG